MHSLVRRVAYQLLYAVACIQKLAPEITDNINQQQDRSVLEFYNKAKNVYPFDGKVFTDLGQHPLLEDDL